MSALLTARYEPIRDTPNIHAVAATVGSGRSSDALEGPWDPAAVTGPDPKGHETVAEPGR